jgi:phosphohistidine phosphatase
MVKTKRLWIARHAEAIDDYDDFNRILTTKGYRQAVNVGKEIANYKIPMSEIWTSAAVRTFLTAHFFADQLGFDKQNIQSHQELYNASVRVWLQTINQQFHKNSSDVLIVGHNPHISYLVELLTGQSFEGLRPSQVALVESEKEWSEWTEKVAVFKTIIVGLEDND